MREPLTPDRLLARQYKRKPHLVHIRKRTQCQHEDCKAFPELADACYRDRLRLTFGVPAAEVRPIALCGIGTQGTSRDPLVEPSRTFGAQWIITLEKAILRAERAELRLVGWMLGPPICSHCLSIWAGPSKQAPAFTQGEVLAMARGDV